MHPQALGEVSALNAFTDAIKDLEASLSEDPHDSRRVMVLAFALEQYSDVLAADAQGTQKWPTS
jgi:hypothetical protein